MQIVLLRHGKPDITTNGRISPRQYGEWVKEYNRASISQDSAPDDAAREMARQCDYVVCSDLARSVDSARALGVDTIHICDPLFREFEMPYSHWKLPGFSPAVWTVLFRLMWLAGYSSNAESYQAARRRAAECMHRLTAYAEGKGKVLFVGHGTLLWYLAKHLRANGWHGPVSSPRRHWAFGIYEYRTA